MEKVVIIGANEFQNKLIKKAKDLGYETHVFAWKCGDIGEKTADYFYPISIIEKDKILEKCRKIKPAAIMSIASDLASITVDYIADKLGLTCNNPKFTDIRTNKYEMRKALKNNNIEIPIFEKVSDIKECTINNFPLIVKPTDRSGSRAIALVNNKKELKEAIENAISNSFEKKAIVEEVIYGNEYSCECISYKGEHTFLTLTKKYTTGFPKCIETGHLQPSDLEDEQIEHVKKIVFQALNALHIENGASHTEFKIDDEGKIRIIEIGARMAGDCIGSDLVYLSTGLDYLKMVLDIALGKNIVLEKNTHYNYSMIKFFFDEKDFTNFEEIMETMPEVVKEYYKKEKVEEKVIDSSSRKGYYIMATNKKNNLKLIKEKIYDI